MGKDENRNPLNALISLLATRFGVLAGALLLVVILSTLVIYPRMMTSSGEVHTNNQIVIANTTVRFQQDILPVLERRCVVCHACYDAPCQLKLSSYEGIERGASKAPVYNPSRLTPMEPTRLFMDASTTAKWRTKGFYSVTNKKQQAGETASVNSLLISMIEHGRSHPLAQNQKLPESINLDLDRELTCPTEVEFDKYARKNEFGGMPYGTAPLSDLEYQKIRDWALLGAPGSQVAPEITPETVLKIQAWETLLNGPGAKQKLAARFVYEHLFLAHLYFDDAPLGLYFRLVRSKTPTGQPIEVLHKRHPNSAPGPDPFYYRLRPIASTIVHKTHIIYPLNAVRRARIKSLLFDSDWNVETSPVYEAKNASNPFVTFAAIPARARYEFMLDNVRFFIMAFIRGPVCRGQVALNVIDDHFYVAFVDPDHDLSVTDPGYLERAKTLIKIPEDSGSPMTLLLRWKKYLSAHRGYLEYRENAYFQRDPRGRLNAMDALWAGNAYNDESFLTVFRHFDSASVVPGFVGEVPKKILVMDYPVLEQIYYNLVVNFDVFGNVTHQLLTRLSMDYLRMEAEDITLGFLPAKARHDARAKWYEGAEAQINLFLAHKMASQKRGTSLTFETDAPIREFITKIFATFPQLSEAQDVLNRCHDEKCRSITPLSALTSTPGKFVQQMPDLVYLRVRSAEKGDQVYSIVRNKAHTNVAFIFGEEKRRRPENDTLTIVEGFMGSYPNFFFQVKADQLEVFVDALHAIENIDDFARFVENYGVRRSSADFWAASDWFNAQYKRTNPVEAGLLDLNRYRNH
jgi:Fatty acid cis/trans isomerase (CTI)